MIFKRRRRMNPYATYAVKGLVKRKNDVEGPIVAYRSWRWDGKQLIPLNDYGRHDWNGSDWARAACRRHFTQCIDHDVPSNHCSCGFYGWHDLEYVMREVNYITGAILCMGKVQVHYSGLRAEYAKPLAFGYTSANRTLSIEAATRYKLPCVPLEMLMDWSKEQGDTIHTKDKPSYPSKWSI